MVDYKRIANNIAATTIVEKICKSLKEFGIKDFIYKRIYGHGKTIYLSNNQCWAQHYFKNSLYYQCLFHPDHFANPCIYLWDHQTSSSSLLRDMQQFDIANGITFIEKHVHYYEFISFAGSQKDTWLQNFFINHVEFLRKFIKYFRQQYQKQFDESLLQTIIFNEKRAVTISKIPYSNNNTFSNAMLNFEQQQNTSQIKSAQPKNIIDKLTTRERECIAYLLKGKSAKQTARMMSLSHRTIEFYFERIKKKINVPTKLALLSIINTFDESLIEL